MPAADSEALSPLWTLRSREDALAECHRADTSGCELLPCQPAFSASAHGLSDVAADVPGNALQTLLGAAQRPSYDLVCCNAVRALEAYVSGDASRETSHADGPARLLMPALAPLWQAGIGAGARLGFADAFRLGPLDLGFSRADICGLVTATARLCTFSDFLASCDVTSRQWFLQHPMQTRCVTKSRLLCFTDGSFVPATRGRPPLMGWAVAVFVAYAHGMSCLGVLNGPVHPALFTPDSETNPFLPECAALISAALLAASNYPSLDIAFVGDCQPALSCASGQCCTSGGVPQAAVRNSHLFRSSSSPGTLEYHHVKSHEGDFANEVVDVAARMAAHDLFLEKHKWPQLNSWLARGGACLSWASLVCRSLQGDVSLPDFAGGHLGDDADLAGLSVRRGFRSLPCRSPVARGAQF